VASFAASAYGNGPGWIHVALHFTNVNLYVIVATIRTARCAHGPAVAPWRVGPARGGAAARKKIIYIIISVALRPPERRRVSGSSHRASAPAAAIGVARLGVVPSEEPEGGEADGLHRAVNDEIVDGRDEAHVVVIELKPKRRVRDALSTEDEHS